MLVFSALSVRHAQEKQTGRFERNDEFRCVAPDAEHSLLSPPHPHLAFRFSCDDSSVSSRTFVLVVSSYLRCSCFLPSQNAASGFARFPPPSLLGRTRCSVAASPPPSTNAIESSLVVAVTAAATVLLPSSGAEAASVPPLFAGGAPSSASGNSTLVLEAAASAPHVRAPVSVAGTSSTSASAGAVDIIRGLAAGTSVGLIS